MVEPMRSDDEGAGTADRDSPPGMPRWVKWSLVVVAVLIVAVVVSVLVGVRHGPGMHSPGGGSPTSVAPGGHALNGGCG
jgi:hypothetical protein